MQNFFDRYPRFLETSTVGTQARHGKRLHWRWRAIVEANPALFDNARVLDIASHDGRWSMAALDAGAAHVTGIEGRASLVANARETLGAYAPGRHEFIVGDVLAEMPKINPPLDLILNFGFLYHTRLHYEVFEQMARLKPKAVILDTVVAEGDRAVVRYYEEPTGWDGAAIGDGAPVIVGAPSHKYIAMLCRTFGFRLSPVDWTTLGITDWTGLEDYANGSRRTYVLLA